MGLIFSSFRFLIWASLENYSTINLILHSQIFKVDISFDYMKNKLIFELKRKSIHLLSLIFLIIYIILESLFAKKIALLSLTSILIIFLILDYYRIVKKKKIPILHIFWRKEEANKLGGNVYFLIGVILSFAFFDYYIALTALLMTTFGDAAAALVGISFGKHYLKKHKTKAWEGIIAQFLVDVIISLIILNNLITALGMSLAATFVETKFHHIDDNLSIPIFSGFVGEILNFIK